MPGRVHTARLVPPVEFDGKQDIGSPGPSIGNPGIVGRVLEVRVFDIDIRKAVTERCEVHQSFAGRNQGRDSIDEGEIAEMVGAELRLEAIGRVTKGGRHDTGTGNDDIEAMTITSSASAQARTLASDARSSSMRSRLPPLGVRTRLVRNRTPAEFVHNFRSSRLVLNIKF